MDLASRSPGRRSVIERSGSLIRWVPVSVCPAVASWSALPVAFSHASTSARSNVGLVGLPPTGFGNVRVPAPPVGHGGTPDPRQPRDRGRGHLLALPRVHAATLLGDTARSKLCERWRQTFTEPAMLASCIAGCACDIGDTETT